MNHILFAQPGQALLGGIEAIMAILTSTEPVWASCINWYQAGAALGLEAQSERNEAGWGHFLSSCLVLVLPGLAFEERAPFLFTLSRVLDLSYFTVRRLSGSQSSHNPRVPLTTTTDCAVLHIWRGPLYSWTPLPLPLLPSYPTPARSFLLSSIPDFVSRPINQRNLDFSNEKTARC